MIAAGRRRGLMQAPGRWRGLGRVLAVCGVILVSMIPASCKYTANQRPPIDALETTLKIGISTQQDVIAVLGKPSGKGGSFLPVDDKSRSALSYYYEEGTVNAESGRVHVVTNRVFLWVYIGHDRYDGYMWFTTLATGSN